jgi:hypothetical protein
MEGISGIEEQFVVQGRDFESKKALRGNERVVRGQRKDFELKGAIRGTETKFRVTRTGALLCTLYRVVRDPDKRFQALWSGSRHSDGISKTRKLFVATRECL